jgi:hypothetical protein
MAMSGDGSHGLLQGWPGRQATGRRRGGGERQTMFWREVAKFWREEDRGDTTYNNKSVKNKKFRSTIYFSKSDL